MTRIIAGLVFTAVCFFKYQSNIISNDAMVICIGIATVLLAFGVDEILAKDDRNSKNDHT